MTDMKENVKFVKLLIREIIYLTTATICCPRNAVHVLTLSWYFTDILLLNFYNCEAFVSNQETAWEEEAGEQIILAQSTWRWKGRFWTA